MFAHKFLFYPLYELATGRRVLSKWREFERTQWLSTSELKVLQRQRLRDLLSHAYEHVPFYRRRIDAVGRHPVECAEAGAFSQLHPVTKEDIQLHRDEMVAGNLAPAALKLNATGGSTGHTLSFFNDRASLDFRSAVTLRGDRWAGLNIGTPHTRLWGAPLDLKAQEEIISRMGNRLLNRQWLDCFRLSEQALVNYVERIRRFRPRVLLGYASALTMLAQFLEVHNIHDIRLQSVISSAETLYDEERQRIEAAFMCKVYDRYGCREAGPLIVQCSEGRMHVNADYVLVELLRNGRPASPGELGEIVITPLQSYGMPLIRYKIGDLGVAAEQSPCPCGRGLPTIERVIGRTSGVLANARGDIFHGEFFTHLFYHQPGVRQFQIIQHDPESLRIRVVTGPEFDPTTYSHVDKRILHSFGDVDIQWEVVDQIPPLESGKRCFTISSVEMELGSNLPQFQDDH